MAALVFVGAMTAGCSSDDLTAETPQPADAGKTVVMKITISLSESASTRALTEAGVKTFAMGDQIAVIYKNTAGETVKVESAALLGTDLYDAGQNATFSVVLTNPEPSTAVRYIYPASMAAAAVATDVATNDDATINYAALATQDGTLATIASTLDLAVFDGTLTDQAALPPATLENPLTIGKFTIKNSATDDDITSTVTNLTINDGTNTYTVHRTAAAGPIYVAMKPIASTQTVTVNATDGTNNYTKSVTDKVLAASNIYDITVNATKYLLVLGAALKTGAIVTINYSVGENIYKATFTKNSDDSYTFDSNEDITPAGARGMTRTDSETYVPEVLQLITGNEELHLVVKSSSPNYTPIFRAEFNIVDGGTKVFNTNGVGLDCKILSFNADNKPLEIKNSEMSSVIIEMDPVKYPVKFIEGDTWADVVKRNKDLDVIEIATTTDGYISVKLSMDLVVNTFMERGIEQVRAEDFYTNEYSATFYLINSKTDAHVMENDAVDPQATYSLGTTAPYITPYYCNASK